MNTRDADMHGKSRADEPGLVASRFDADIDAVAPQIRIGAVLYTPETEQRHVLAPFAAELKRRGWRVGGLVQEIMLNDDGSRLGLDAVEVDTGAHIPLARPTAHDLETKTCSLDRSALAASTAALRRAIADKVDLVVVEKFGEREQEGEGLAEEILTAAAEGIPVLVAVPAGVLERWNTFTGGLSDLLPCTEDALWRWWGADPLIEELRRAVSDVSAKRVVVGRNWTLVEGPDGCGLAKSPAHDHPGCRAIPGVGTLAGRPLNELASLAQSWNPAETAIGVAAINAHFNRYDLQAPHQNGLDVFAAIDAPVAVIGRFPGLAERLRQPLVVEQFPKEGEFASVAAPRLMARCEAAAVTSSTLVNRTLEGLLRARGTARFALVGPGTPMAPQLHAYGIEVLSGLVVEDVDQVVALVGEGAGVKAIKPYCRFVTLKGD